MKSIMISIKPKWCAKIMNGRKTIEVRKNKALANAIKKLINENGYADIYVYCSKDKKYAGLVYRGGFITGMVAFKFRCYFVKEISSQIGRYEYFDGWFNDFLDKCCLDFWQLKEYLNRKNGYAIYISDLEIFDRPRELREFYTMNQAKSCSKSGCPYFRTEKCKNAGECSIQFRLTKAPQNFCYVEVE